MLSALINRINLQNQVLTQEISQIKQYRLIESRWFMWQVFIWAFLRGRFGRFPDDGLEFKVYTLDGYRSRASGQLSLCFTIRPNISWGLVDEFGEKVLGVKDFSLEFIPF